MANQVSKLRMLRKTLRGLCKDFDSATEPSERSTISRSIAHMHAEMRQAELHEQALRPEAKTPEEHEARIRIHFEALPKPRQVEVAKSLGMIAGDGTLLGR